MQVISIFTEWEFWVQIYSKYVNLRYILTFAWKRRLLEKRKKNAQVFQIEFNVRFHLPSNIKVYAT